MIMTHFTAFFALIAAGAGQESVMADPELRNQQIPSGAERVIIVTREQCNLLTPHIPDVDVEYKPGKDARGRDVVPADLNGGNDPLGIGENGYSFLMVHDALGQANLESQYGLTGSQEGKIVLGQVTVKDGDVFWNGQSLREAERNRVYMLCNQERSTKRRPIIKR